MIRSIRSKMVFFSFAFILLFNAVAIGIYWSSERITNEYSSSFDRFVLLNSISRQAEEWTAATQQIATNPSQETWAAYYQASGEMKALTEELGNEENQPGSVEMQSYMQLLDSLEQNSETTAGFVLQGDIEKYGSKLAETEQSNAYIQESTLTLIDQSLTDYQQLYAQLQERNTSFRYFIICLFATSLLIAVFIAFRFSSSITKPVDELSRAAGEVSRGHFQGEPLRISSGDELELLGRTFNRMRTDIHTYVGEMEKKAEMDQLMKQLELKHLQNQINPHFLFNTLNTISKMAYLEDAEETSELIGSVSSLLRYSLGNIEKEVTLRDELDVIRSYFHIQETRFRNRLSTHIEIETEELDVAIPRLTLQPVIENAFIHGVEGMEENAEVRVQVRLEDSQIVVRVMDNGKGMNERQRQQLIGAGKEPEAHVGHSTGLGMQNVRRRLELFFHAGELVDVESVPARGTTVTLRMPVKEWQKAGGQAG